jgi:FkbM family methyltransferase
MAMMHASDRSAAWARAYRFCQKPWAEKANSVRFRWTNLKSDWTRAAWKFHVPIRLPFGAWWIPRQDNLFEPLVAGAFERSELAFVERFLQPGMNVLDIGAHQGLYTLLSSRRVGYRGKVIAFEPSPRERRALRLHTWLNLRANVSIEKFALGNEEKESDLFVVDGDQTGCNSLRPPVVHSGTSRLRVQVTRLDDWLKRREVDQVHFIKLDVEGAELEVLKGAQRLLECHPRPVILAEVQDIRTQSWGYQAAAILEHLVQRGFTWFKLSENSSLQELDVTQETFDGNFVAWPKEVKPLYRGT